MLATIDGRVVWVREATDHMQRVFEEVRRRPGTTTREVARNLKLPQYKVSQIARTLAEADLIDREETRADRGVNPFTLYPRTP